MNIQRSPIFVKTHHIKSSFIDEAGYDKKSHTLQVDMNSGRDYQYYDVPRPVYSGLIHAPSKGGYYNHAIKGHYESARVDVEA